MTRATQSVHRFWQAVSLALALILLPSGAARAGGDGTAQTFANPQEAATALITAAREGNRGKVLAILGPSTEEWLESGDPVQDREARKRFVDAYQEAHAIETEDGGTAILVVGGDKYPFPFPIVKRGRGWAFDAEQGREEVLARRIGENELNTVQVLHAIADAEHEYARGNPDGAYASKFRSSEGKHDGLYWPTEGNENPSPLGSLIATAAAEGYTAKKPAEESGETQPYHGYRFKILIRQGKNAPGGAYDYMAGGRMIGGFAVLAWPAKYGVSGIMSFLISHDGKVYESNLGPDTGETASKIESFDPGKDWTALSEEEEEAVEDD